MKENPKVVICLKNPDLDCPEECPLYQKSISVIQKLADENGISYAEAVNKTRSMNPLLKREVMVLIEKGFKLLEKAGGYIYCKKYENNDIVPASERVN